MCNSDERPRALIRSPADLLQVIPHLLGFRPARSVVVIGLSRGGRHVVITARVDWADAASPQCRAALVQALDNAGAETAMVVLYPDCDRVGPVPNVVPAPEDLAGMVTAQLAAAGLPVAVAVTVDRDCWALLPDSTTHWPHAGVLRESDPPSAALTAMVASGLGALPDRAAVERSLARFPPGRRLHAELGAGSQLPLTAAALVDTLHLWEVLVASLGRAEWSVPDDSAMTVVHALRDIRFRDVACSFACRPDSAAAESLARQLARRAPDGACAPPYATCAWLAWQRGDGVSAGIAVDHALDDEPDYSLAILIATALRHALPPHPMSLDDYGELAGRLAPPAERGRAAS